MSAHAPVQFLLIAASFCDPIAAAAKLKPSQTTGKPCSSGCQSYGYSKNVEIILILMTCIVLLIFVAVVVSRYYAKRTSVMRAQKQVQLFDELMERTREKHRIMRISQKQRGNEDKLKTMRVAGKSVMVQSRTAAPSTEIRQPTDEYGRNIVRIQTHRSLLYENAIEIKESGEDDEQEECFNTNSASPVEK